MLDEAFPHKADVGRRLRFAIEETLGSQAEFCRVFDLESPKVNNWVQGRHYPEMGTIVHFCERCKITMDWIYRGDASGVPKALADKLLEREHTALAA